MNIRAALAVAFVCALPQAFLRAELKLSYFENGAEHEVTGLKEGAVMLANGEVKRVSGDDWSWRIAGDVLEHAALLDWSPEYAIRRFSDDLEGTRSLRPLRGWATVRHDIMRDHEGRKQESRFLDRWPDGIDDEALIVVAWLLDGRIHAASIQPAGSTAQGFTIRIERQLTEDEARGQPAVLLWQNGGFVASRPRCSDPLMQRALVAALLDDAGALRECLAAGVDANGLIEDNLTLMHFAAEAGALNAIEALLEARPGKGFKKISPLHWAAAKGRAAALERLLEAGYPKDARDVRKATPLISAAHGGHLAAAEVLIERHAKVAVEDFSVYFPLGIAVDNGYAALAETLRRAGARIDFRHSQQKRVLITQAAEGHAAMVKWLIERRVNPNFEDRGRTALTVAAWRGNADVIKVLLAGGADPNRVTSSGAAPLLVAASYLHAPIVAALLDAGAQIDVRSKSGLTALHMAALRDAKDIVSLLVARGADVNAEDAGGRRPLDLALGVGAEAAARVLSEHGAGILLDTEWRGRVLAAMVRFDMVDSLRHALAGGLDPRAEIAPGWPLLHAAETLRSERCARLLRETGANNDDVELTALALPHELDEPLQPTLMVRPDDPREDDEVYTEQKVTVDFVVDRDGKPLFPRIVDTEDKRFAAATIAAIEHWRFRPITAGGKPAAVRARIPVTFPSSEERVFDTNSLDAVPMAIKQTLPVFPPKALADGRRARVLIRFIVDRDGEVREPRVVESTDPEHAKAALAALQKWKFKPGERDGKPVAVQMMQPFSFILDR